MKHVLIRAVTVTVRAAATVCRAAARIAHVFVRPVQSISSVVLCNAGGAILAAISAALSLAHRSLLFVIAAVVAGAGTPGRDWRFFDVSGVV